MPTESFLFHFRPKGLFVRQSLLRLVLLCPLLIFLPGELSSQEGSAPVADVPPHQNREKISSANQLYWGIGPELTVIGLSYGVRLELLYDLSTQRSHLLRFAPGFLYSAEFLYLPVALGYQFHFGKASSPVRFFIGAGLEYQLRMIADGRDAHQGALYSELGLTMAPNRSMSIEVVLFSDWAFLGPMGPGAGARVLLHFPLG